MSGLTCNYKDDMPDVAFNDLYLDESGNLAVSNGNEEIVENVYHAIQLWSTEYQFNTLLGINWKLYISSDTPRGIQLKTSLTQTVLSVTGVNRVLRLDMEVVLRKLIIELVIVLDSGQEATILRSFT